MLRADKTFLFKCFRPADCMRINRVVMKVVIYDLPTPSHCILGNFFHV